MRVKTFQRKILGNVKLTVLFIISFLLLDKLFESIGTSIFFGINFRFIPWIILLFAIISVISDLSDVKWIKKVLKKIFN